MISGFMVMTLTYTSALNTTSLDYPFNVWYRYIQVAVNYVCRYGKFGSPSCLYSHQLIVLQLLWETFDFHTQFSFHTFVILPLYCIASGFLASKPDGIDIQCTKIYWIDFFMGIQNYIWRSDSISNHFPMEIKCLQQSFR